MIVCAILDGRGLDVQHVNLITIRLTNATHGATRNTRVETTVGVMVTDGATVTKDGLMHCRILANSPLMRIQAVTSLSMLIKSSGTQLGPLPLQQARIAFVTMLQPPPPRQMATTTQLHFSISQTAPHLAISQLIATIP